MGHLRATPAALRISHIADLMQLLHYYPAGDVPAAIRCAGLVPALLNTVENVRYDSQAAKYRVDWDNFVLPPRGL